VPRPTQPILSRDLILRTALSMLDRTGRLNVSEVAQELGVSVSSLYHHVKGRAAIIEGIRGLLVDWESGDQRDWRTMVTDWARHYQDAFAKHPAAIPALVSQTVSDPGALRQYDALATELARAGFSAGLAHVPSFCPCRCSTRCAWARPSTSVPHPSSGVNRRIGSPRCNTPSPPPASKTGAAKQLSRCNCHGSSTEWPNSKAPISRRNAVPRRGASTDTKLRSSSPGSTPATVTIARSPVPCTSDNPGAGNFYTIVSSGWSLRRHFRVQAVNVQSRSKRWLAAATLAKELTGGTLVLEEKKREAGNPMNLQGHKTFISAALYESADCGSRSNSCGHAAPRGTG
jgi:AcrR family transcriptional regulator